MAMRETLLPQSKMGQRTNTAVGTRSLANLHLFVLSLSLSVSLHWCVRAREDPENTESADLQRKLEMLNSVMDHEARADQTRRQMQYYGHCE
jgi:hypothetical protein